MIKFIAVLALAASAAHAECDSRLRSVTGNWEVNLLGQTDTRPNTWGCADAVIKTLTFRPPAGCRVEVLKVRGDLVAWPMFADGKTPIRADDSASRPLTPAAGTLLSIAKTGPEGSVWADLAEDKTLLYVQLPVDGLRSGRAGFSEEVVDGLLRDDHKLEFKLASWLNALAVPVHIESTWTIHYRFVGAPK